MFHYVKENFNYYHLDANLFDKVIQDLLQKHNIITLEQYYYNIKNHIDSDDILLTFDDGTIDHYQYVFPILKKYKITGVFFICSNIFNDKNLDIQYIHQIMSKIGINKFYDEIYNRVDDKSFFALSQDKEVIIKKLLQNVLPLELRKSILLNLIKKYNISTNVEDYYLSKEQIQEMLHAGMYFGLHTTSHVNLCSCSYQQQLNEIKENLSIFSKYGIVSTIKSIAYPFGNYNQDTLKIIQELGIDLGFSINKSDGTMFTIKRYDCNVLKERKKK